MKIELEETPKTKSLSRCSFVFKDAKRYFRHCLPNIFTIIYKKISTFPPRTVSAAVNSDVEPPHNKKTTLSSLPDEIIVSFFARIPKSHYPKISLVSKRFRSLILSNELYFARSHHKTQENVLYVCLQLPDHRLPCWFSLWIKSDQPLTNDMEEENNNSTGNNTLLVKTPSSYCPRVPTLSIARFGLRLYSVLQYNVAPTSSLVWVGNGENYDWRKAPSMKVVRENAVADILYEKIYVMGGCNADECLNWAEVFDPKTQTWESLPDPGAELRGSLIKTMNTFKGKVYVSCSEKNDYVYDPKEGTWEVVEEKVLEVERKCVIENVWYSCVKGLGIFWYDTKREEWRLGRGLDVLNRNCCCGVIIALANYCGKLLILWDEFEQHGRSKNKNIWCSVVAVERRNDYNDVWGNVEWASVVLKVPTSYVFLRSEVKKV